MTPPSVNCPGAGCDSINQSSAGATGVKGLDAVDSATQSTNVLGQDIEPGDQTVCAGHGFVVESNNLGEILIFNTHLQRVSAVIPLDTIMGLTARNWSSGGDISCLYDYSNGGHWFFTEIVSASTEASGGPFSGCFAGNPDGCYEGIAVTRGSNPFGPYNVYFANANYNPAEPGAPNLLNDFAKIGTTQDAFLYFYDEFPLLGSNPGLGGGGFNGAQEMAFSKTALEFGLPTTLPNGNPDPFLNVAIENMGLIPTPDGSCAATHGALCWYQVIPAQASDPSGWDNRNGGTGYMLGSLDFIGRGDNRVAVFDWTGLRGLNSFNCFACSGIQFGAQLFSGTDFYFGEGQLGAQKAGPIPLGDECGAAGLSVSPGGGAPPPASCPEGGIATNGDGMTQVAAAQGQIWGAITTEVGQTFAGEAAPEVHQGVLYFVISSNSFDRTGTYSLTSQSYVSAAHEDLEFPAMAASDGNSSGDQDNQARGRGDDGGGGGSAIITFSLSGNGGPTGADNGGYYPSTAFGQLTATSNGLLGSTINIVDMGQSPQDGFTEYQGYPGPLRPRWGDYSWAVFMPGSGQGDQNGQWGGGGGDQGGQGGTFIFSTNYIQSPNCMPPDFTLTLGTCGGTRDGFANWGTSVNSFGS